MPVAPGGALDILARLMGQWLSDHLGQTFVIENRPGGGTNIGVDAVVHAAPDGYTLLLVRGSVTAERHALRDLTFDFMRDIVPIAMIIEPAAGHAGEQRIPAKTVPEFVAWAKKNPGKVSFASGGTGSTSHLAASCSSWRPASTWCTCPIAAARRPSPI